MYQATPTELGEAIGSIIGLRQNFFQEPKNEGHPEEEPGSSKNA
jgi:hypothetical protein